MYKLYYLDQARDDLIQIRRYIARESDNQEIALEYTNRIREQCRKLAQLPGELGRSRSELGSGLRSFTYGNYVIIFRYLNDCLAVVTIIEGHRDIEALLK